MGDVKLLDCTLRDGGYLNDWEFGHNTIISVFSRLVSAKVDIIETGFLDERRCFDINRTIMPDTATVEKIYGKLNSGSAMIVGMIDYGTCGIGRIQKCSESYLDGIRIIFKESLMREALVFCKEVKDLGYKVFAQMVSITTYTDEKIKEFCGLVNAFEPYAVSIVDTYGLLHQDRLIHYFRELDKNLNPGISLGYHSHNNFQMAYANCIEILSSHTDRNVVVDGTLYGMGKSAGNAPIELLAMYMNENCSKNYDVSQILEAIDANIMELYRKYQWGYNLLYFISASEKCHPNYVSYLLNKKTLAVKSVREILNRIPDENKLLYDPKTIENLYLEYQDQEWDDALTIKRLEEIFRTRELLLLGPGSSVVRNEEELLSCYIKSEPFVIAINYIPQNMKVDFLFVTNSKRYVQLLEQLSAKDAASVIPIIATSNLTKTEGRFDYILNYGRWMDPDALIPDNSFVMLLKVIMQAKVRKVKAAGFDGYTEDRANYFNTEMEYGFAREMADYLNQYTSDFLQKWRDTLQVEFITPSLYSGGREGTEGGINGDTVCF